MERVLFSYLLNHVELGGYLATYQGRSAVFYQKAPTSEDPLWEKPCFPHVEFVIDRVSDSERQESGKLTFHIWVSSDVLSLSGGSPDKEIANILQNAVDGAFFRHGEVITCATWVNSYAFVRDVSQINMEISPVETYGIIMQFDLLDCHNQPTTDPDPIYGANLWVKELFPWVTVIGLDEIPEVWLPKPSEMAVYWRFVGYEGDHCQGYSVNWYHGKLALHIFADSVTKRNQWLKVLAEALQLDGEILLPDESPMFLTKVQVIHSLDRLRDGQLLIVGKYGVLASKRKNKGCFSLRDVEFSIGES